MKNLFLTLFLITTSLSAQVVSFGYTGIGDLRGGFIGYNESGHLGGELHIKGDGQNFSYVGGLVTLELLDEDDFNIEFGGGIEAQEEWETTSSTSSVFIQRRKLLSVRYAPMFKVSGRWNFIELGATYGASGANFTAGFILNR